MFLLGSFDSDKVGFNWVYQIVLGLYKKREEKITIRQNYLIIKFPEGPASRDGLDPSKSFLSKSAEDLGTFAQRNWGLLKQGWFCSQ